MRCEFMELKWKPFWIRAETWGPADFVLSSWLKGGAFRELLERWSRQLRRLTGLEDGFDFGVDRDVRGGNAIDGILRPSGFGKMEEAADVVVLVVAGEQPLGFGGGEGKGGERYGLGRTRLARVR